MTESNFFPMKLSRENTTLSLIVLPRTVVRMDCSSLEFMWFFGLGNGQEKHHGQCQDARLFSSSSVRIALSRLAHDVCQIWLQLLQSIFQDSSLDVLHGHWSFGLVLVDCWEEEEE